MLLSYRSSLILIFIGVIAISTGPVLAKLTDLSPLTVSLYRVVFAFMPLCLQFLYLNKSDVKKFSVFLVILSILSGICLGCDIMLFYISLDYTNIANSIVLVNLAPVIVFFYDKLQKKQRIHFAVKVCIIFIICGVVLIMWHKISLQNPSLWGEGLALGAALFYAVYLVIAQKVADQCGDSIRTNLWITIGVGIICCITCFVYAENLVIDSYSNLALLIANAWIAQFFGQFCLLLAMQKLPLCLSSLQLLLQPVFVTLMSWYFLNESIAKLQSFGLILVVSSTYIISYQAVLLDKKNMTVL